MSATLSSADTPLLPSEIEVKSGDETFYFKVPSPRDLARMGSRSTALAAADEPFMGRPALDPFTQNLYRGFALFETLLVRADATWPYTQGPDGKPYVDSSKFPTESTYTVTEVYQGFSEALEKFLSKPGKAG